MKRSETFLQRKRLTFCIHQPIQKPVYEKRGIYSCTNHQYEERGSQTLRPWAIYLRDIWCLPRHHARSYSFH